MSRKHKPSVPTVTGLSVLAVAFLLVPLIGLLISAPWPDMLSTLSSPNALQALRLSIITSVSAAALAAVLGGTQSLHTNSMDETYALPTEASVKVALRTQQIIADETGVASVVDPLEIGRAHV